MDDLLKNQENNPEVPEEIVEKPVQEAQYIPQEPVQEPQYVPQEPVQEPQQYAPQEPVQEQQYAPQEPVQEPQYAPQEPVQEQQYAPQEPVQEQQYIPQENWQYPQQPWGAPPPKPNYNPNMQTQQPWGAPPPRPNYNPNMQTQQPWGAPPPRPNYNPNMQAQQPWGAQAPTYNQGAYQNYQSPNMQNGQAYGYNQNYQNPYGYPVNNGKAQEKKSINKGILVFLIVLSSVAVIAIAGFVISMIWGMSNSSSSSGNIPSGGDYGFQLPDSSSDEGDDESNSDDFVVDDSYLDDLEIPEIDVQGYEDGIVLEDIPTTEELSPNEVYEKVVVSTVTVEVQIPLSDGSYEESIGTGIVLTTDGFILTNSHVVNDSKSVLVTIATSDGESYEAVVVGYDKATDLAVLKTDGGEFVPAEFADSDQMEMGDWVMAIGNPGGTEFTGSVTRGIISGLDRNVGYSADSSMTYIQTDAAINPGNSGGPLVNMYGQVIGINTSKIVADYYEGMGFAIPVSDAQDIINDLLSQGYVSGRVRLGITAVAITEETAAYYGMKAGIVIYSIDEGSSFEGTEVQIGDTILSIDGEFFDDITELSEKFLSYQAGDVVEVVIYREETDEEFTVSITLIEDNGETQN